jgi:hypothetical protein
MERQAMGVGRTHRLLLGFGGGLGWRHDYGNVMICSKKQELRNDNRQVYVSVVCSGLESGAKKATVSQIIQTVKNHSVDTE